jgi:membrane protein implicated in regulation of membrane protease activity
MSPRVWERAMTWSDLYLGCFIVGFSLSLLSFLAGAVHIHLPFNLHWPHSWHFGGHNANLHFGSHGAAGAHAPSGNGSSQQGSGSHLSWFNASTVLAFLAWFGGVGYILATHSTMLTVVALAFATLAGLGASWIVFRFMVKLMNEEGSYMRDEDYRPEGIVATVTIPIRENGTGEIVYLQGGVRKSAGARSHDGKPLERGAEVVTERYEDGIAYVHRWSEFTKLDQ